MNSIKKTSLFGGTLVAAGLCTAASAQTYTGVDGDTVSFFVGDGGIIASSVLCEEWDLGTLPDLGIVGFDGPVGPAGNAYIPAGFFTYATIDSQLSGPGGGSRGAGGTGLVGVGPSAGFGNPANAVAANFFVDAFGIDLGGEKCRSTFTAYTFLGGTDVEIYADGVLLGTVPSGTTFDIFGNHSSVWMYDRVGGAEGMGGYGATYTIPAPGALALLGLGGLAAARRRR